MFKSRKTTGFTMVEIIVALTIMGISMLAIFGVLKTCSQAEQHCEMLTKAQLLAETLLNETMLKQTIAFQTTKGQKDGLRWEVQTAPTEFENLGAVCVLVKWHEQQRSKSCKLYSLIHTPPVMEGK